MKMKRFSYFEMLIFVIPFLLVSKIGFTQTAYCTVSHSSGTSLVTCTGGGYTNVTVSSYGYIPFFTNGTLCPKPAYRIGIPQYDTVMTNGHNFKFEPAVSRVRIVVVGIDSAEKVHFYINGQKHNLSSQEISVIHCAQPNSQTAIAKNGYLTVDTSRAIFNDAQVDIIPNYAIQTLTVEHSGFTDFGEIFSLEVSMDTTVYIPLSFSDTLICAGDSLHINYSTILKFNSSNVFTAQLSDASGSFSSPVSIGSLSSDTAGIIHCKVPTNAVGNGYRIRIVASTPSKISADNGKDITISNIKPANLSASNNSPLCENSMLNLTAVSTTSGIQYLWNGPDNFTSTLKNPIINSVSNLASGTYTAVMFLMGCKDSVTTNVQVKPLPIKPVAASNGPLCIGSALNLTATTITNGATYHWTGPNNYSSTQQNPIINTTTLQMAGSYSVYSILNGCNSFQSDTTVVNILKGPQISIVPSPSNIICDGDSITFLAFVTDTSSGTTYHWEKNGTVISGANKLTHKIGGLMTGDNITCVLTPGLGSSCNTPINSASIPVIVNGYLTPTVNISSDYGSDVWENLLVTFTANTTNSGAKPKYQWKKNGQDVVGAISQIWAATTLKNDDEISCEITSDYECPKPKKVLSNSIKMKINTGVSKTPYEESIQISPNPVSNTLSIKGTEIIEFAITDLMGRVVLHEGINSNTINVSGLTDGIYFLQIVSRDSELRYTFKFIKQ